MTVVEREVMPEILTEREQRARTLEAAALEIEVRGHAKHALMWNCDEAHPYSPGTIKGSVCVLGAIGCAFGWNDDGTFPADDAGNAYGNGLTYAVAFNNADETTPEQVPFLLRWRAEEIRDGL
jgi:hypothetical protein